MKAILLDIEGTTTPIDFVHKTLFPFAKERIGKFVESHFSALHDQINQLVEESSLDPTYTVPVDPTEPGSIASYLGHLIDVDRKSTPLKSIQGMIWEEGYLSGELTSEIFEDVPPAFERWKSEGKTIAIFSSGSVLAQQLLFRHTERGDLTEFIDAYFDTNAGPKGESESYERIAAELVIPAREIIFCSDIPSELSAATGAGMRSILVMRPGNKPIGDVVELRTVTSLADLYLD